MDIIKIKNFSKYYKTTLACDNINISVSKGEIYGFVGPNGAGKSTTIRTMLNFIKPTNGSITLFGMDSTKESKKIKNMIGYVSSEECLYPYMTGKEIIVYAAKLHRVKKEDYIKRMEEYSKYFNLDLNKKIRNYSHGNKRKVAFIISLINNPKLLILDEPTNGLDPIMQKRFKILLTNYKKKNNTVFISSHNLNEIEEICDKIVFIKEGKILDILTKEEIKNHKCGSLEKIFEYYFYEEIGELEI